MEEFITIEGVVGPSFEEGRSRIYFRNYDDGGPNEYIELLEGTFSRVPGSEKDYSDIPVVGKKIGVLSEFIIRGTTKILTFTRNTDQQNKEITMREFADSYSNYKPRTVSPTRIFNNGKDLK